jgi:GNAT superfamily N-acetyltransferase
LRKIRCAMLGNVEIGSVETNRLAAGGATENTLPIRLAVNPVTEFEASRVTDVISDAFLDDPTWSWAFPDPAARRQWWALCVREALRYPWTFKTEGYEAMSVWIPPDGTELSPEAERGVPAQLTDLVGPRTADVGELLERFGRAHPRHEPHYYLSLLGIAPEHRGRGLGMALLHENLARIDAEHMPAYLESSNPTNNPRYEAAGFAAVTSFQAPHDGPVITGMWRNKR